MKSGIKKALLLLISTTTLFCAQDAQKDKDAAAKAFRAGKADHVVFRIDNIGRFSSGQNKTVRLAFPYTDFTTDTGAQAVKKGVANALEKYTTENQYPEPCVDAFTDDTGGCVFLITDFKNKIVPEKFNDLVKATRKYHSSPTSLSSPASAAAAADSSSATTVTSAPASASSAASVAATAAVAAAANSAPAKK